MFRKRLERGRDLRVEFGYLCTDIKHQRMQKSTKYKSREWKTESSGEQRGEIKKKSG